MGKVKKKEIVWEEVLIVSSKFILMLIAFDVVVSSILFIVHIPITRCNFFLAYIISIVVTLKYLHCSKGGAVKSIIASTILIGITVLLNGWIQEIAFDGNLYHKFATGILKLGWNPIYDDINEYIELFCIPADRGQNIDIWVSCYPKASWIFDATIYSLTNNIESAKAFNLLISFATFGLLYNYFCTKISKVNALFISGIFTLIPAVFAQMFTYYLDGSLGNLLTICVVMLLSITDKEYNGSKKGQLFYLGLSVILCGNLKFTGLAYVAVFCFVFFVYWCILIWKKGMGIEGRKKIYALVIYYVLIVLITVCVVGANTYFINIKDYGNPLYPIIGSDIIDSGENLQSVGLEDSLPLRQMLSMIFVRTSTDAQKNYLEWKIPFTFTLSEFKHSVHDTIRGGTGVFFSGILLISLVMLIYLFIKKRKQYKEEFKNVGIIMVVSFVLLTFVPAGGQARYSPYVYYITYFTVYLWFRCCQQKKNRFYIGNIMVVLIMLNAAIFAEYQMRGICESLKYTKQYEEMKKYDYVEIDTILHGVVFNFIDRGIIYEYETIDDLPDGRMKYLQMTYKLKKQ